MMIRNAEQIGSSSTPENNFPNKESVAEIDICICSYRRPTQLKKLLYSLSQLNEDTPPFEVIVVDNDVERTAEPIVIEARKNGLPVTYLEEPEKNISMARNRAIINARARLIAIIDDDEWADPAWLANLYTEMIAHDADAVFGPVVHEFTTSPPQWLTELDFFHYRTPKSGTELTWSQTRTSNVLMTRSIIKCWPQPFDPALGLEGGEDSDLFSRMIDKGYRLVSAENAIVYETVSPDRMKFGWLARRFFRNGVTTERIVAPRLSRVERCVRCAKKSIEALVRTVLGIVICSYSTDRGIRQFFLAIFCLGIMYRSLGFSFREYAASKPAHTPSQGPL